MAACPNPMPRGYEHIAQMARANEVLIAPYVQKLRVEHFGRIYVLTGVNDTGILYWSKPKQKKRFVLGYTVADLPELTGSSAGDPIPNIQWPFRRLGARVAHAAAGVVRELTPGAAGVERDLERRQRAFRQRRRAAAEPPAHGPETRYQGHRIWKEAEGWRTSADPETLFDTQADVKAFIGHSKKGRERNQAYSTAYDWFSEEATRLLRGMTLRELRKRLDLVRAQQQRSYDWYQRSPVHSTERSRMERVSQNLLEHENAIISAIDWRAFGRREKNPAPGSGFSAPGRRETFRKLTRVEHEWFPEASFGVNFGGPVPFEQRRTGYARYAASSFAAKEEAQRLADEQGIEACLVDLRTGARTVVSPKRHPRSGNPDPALSHSAAAQVAAEQARALPQAGNKILEVMRVSGEAPLLISRNARFKGYFKFYFVSGKRSGKRTKDVGPSELMPTIAHFLETGGLR